MLRQRHLRALRSRAGNSSFLGVTSKTLIERLCDFRGGTPEQAARVLFRRSLHVHARPLAPLVLLLWPAHFEPDWELVARVARARLMHEVDDELRSYADDMRNREWWRRHARVRVSGRRLRREARRLLALGEQ